MRDVQAMVVAIDVRVIPTGRAADFNLGHDLYVGAAAERHEPGPGEASSSWIFAPANLSLQLIKVYPKTEN